MTASKATPKFKVGQVVRMNTNYYRGAWVNEQYQRIVAVFPWPACKKSPFGYVLANKDEANEKFLSALAIKERG